MVLIIIHQNVLKPIILKKMMTYKIQIPILMTIKRAIYHKTILFKLKNFKIKKIIIIWILKLYRNSKKCWFKELIKIKHKNQIQKRMRINFLLRILWYLILKIIYKFQRNYKKSEKVKGKFKKKEANHEMP